jgi:hypothetical protein
VKILEIYSKKETYTFYKTEYSKDTDPNVPQITPLLCRSLLEGGIISYDSNILLVVLVLDILGQGVL